MPMRFIRVGQCHCYSNHRKVLSGVEVMFGLVPKWAEDTNIAKHTYNARHETIFQNRVFKEAALKCKFGVIPVTEFL